MSEPVEENNIESNSENANFFIRNTHLIIAVLWGLCGLGIYFYNY